MARWWRVRLATEFLNVRCGGGLKEQVSELAGRDGLAPSSWAREVLSAVVAAGVGLEVLQRVLAGRQGQDPATISDRVRWVNGDRLGATVIVTGACLHPVHLRTEMPTFDVCDPAKGGCGHPIPR
jgi:hypothetical protein